MEKSRSSIVLLFLFNRALIFSLIPFRVLSLNDFSFSAIVLDLLSGNLSLLLPASSAVTIPLVASGRLTAPLTSTDALSIDCLINIDLQLLTVESMTGWWSSSSCTSARTSLSEMFFTWFTKLSSLFTTLWCNCQMGYLVVVEYWLIIQSFNEQTAMINIYTFAF